MNNTRDNDDEAFGKWRDRQWRPSNTLVVIGLIFSIFTYSEVGSITMIPFWVQLSIIILAVAASYIAAGAFLGKEKGFLWSAGITPATIAMLLWMNYLVTTEPRTEVHQVALYSVDLQPFPSISEIIYEFDQHQLHHYEELRRFPYSDPGLEDVKQVEYVYQRGMLGVDILVSKRPI